MSGARTAALAAIAEVVGARHSLERALAIVECGVGDARERALAVELTYGVLRWFPRLDALVDVLLDRPVRRRDRDLRLVIALGLYQVLYTRIPAHAAVSEAVALARARGLGHGAGLVNAVLRRAIRERTELEARLDALEAALHAHPAWLVRAVREAWPEHWRAVLAAGNERPPMTLRVNTAREERRSVVARIEAAGIPARATRWSACGVALDAPAGVEDLPGFSNGIVSVQDEAAQLAAPLLDARPGQRVLDACAAPGGKTAHILERTPSVAEVVAVERSPRRAAMLRAGLDRLGLAARVVEADAARPEAWWDGRGFDRVLLDAPCSATGVIRRHPDIKVLRRESDPGRLAARQAGLLGALWPLLNRGGKLLYATCSMLPAENERVIEQFVDEHADAVPVEIAAEWGIATPLGRQILPGEDGMDGFYYAAIERHG